MLLGFSNLAGTTIMLKEQKFPNWCEIISILTIIKQVWLNSESKTLHDPLWTPICTTYSPNFLSLIGFSMNPGEVIM